MHCECVFYEKQWIQSVSQLFLLFFIINNEIFNKLLLIKYVF